MRTPGFLSVITCFLAGCAAPGAMAQSCTPEVDPGFGAGSFNGGVYCICAFDDGSGPAIYLGGKFTLVGGLPFNRIVRWDGSNWSDVGGGVGSGPNEIPFAMTVYDPPGPDKPVLVVGGDFFSAGGQSITGLASWDGQAWESIGGGIFGVRTLAAADIGDGQRLYIGGTFTFTPAGPANRIVQWNGSTFTPLGDGMNGPVLGLAAHDDGGGPALFATGAFGQAGGLPASNIARWRSGSWSALGSGLDNQGNALVEHFDGTGVSLYVAGLFLNAGGSNALRVAAWRDFQWSPVGTGVNGPVNALASYIRPGDGSHHLLAAGSFTNAGGSPAKNIAAFNGSAWNSLGFGTDQPVRAMAQNPLLEFAKVLVGGDFTKADNFFSAAIAETDANSLDPLFTGADNLIRDVQVFDDGTGEKTYFAGDFNVIGGIKAPGGIARFDGSSWQAMPGLATGGVWTIEPFDDDGDGVESLFVGGRFGNLADGTVANRCAVWNAELQAWEPTGGVLGGGSPVIAELKTFEDHLVAVGQFTATTDGDSAANIASFDGLKWRQIGQGLTGGNAYGSALEPFDADGEGHLELIIGGAFSFAGGAEAANLAALRYQEGFQFANIGAGVDGPVFTLASAAIGEGPALLLGGQFTKTADTGAALNHIALLRQGSPLGAMGPVPGLPDPVISILGVDSATWAADLLISTDPGDNSGEIWEYQDSTEEFASRLLADGYARVFGTELRFLLPRREVWLGGPFTVVGGVSSGGIGRLRCDAAPCYADFTADGALDLFDFLAFVNLFNAQDPAADCDGNGSFDLFDFLCFTNSFNAGC